ncbi:hypothetical protein GALMADRAFT_558676 [Galerina marginata CBS 339.88]|uniref:F-box domain-containing protein n=1 Tax=Galerina marginata (strain CBS 339.88) TaxID=685588 RepID=A0A067SX27_GALM3|nr:hypothetical protein GALMADRAFT_558676 [Galerina marginata CBS 339.88]
MPLPTLPLELVQVILDNIHDEKDLCAVSLTCHGLYGLATPLLYSNITISKWHNADSQFFRFAETMLNKPHLASFVKSFSGPLKSPSSLSDAFYPLQGWLQHIVNLKTLRTTLPPTFYQYLFPDCPFLLESLHIGFYGGTEVIENFLVRQSDLFSLSIARFRPVGSRPLSPLACPNLKVLSGNIYAAKTFFPGRRVLRFVWNYQYGESVNVPPTLLSDISEELNNLRSLSYKIADPAYPTHSMFKGALNPPSAFLRSLRFLEVQFMLPEVRISCYPTR